MGFRRMVWMICIVTIVYGHCGKNKHHSKHSKCVIHNCSINSDPLITAMKSDTFNVAIAKNVYPDASWFRRNEGTLLGAFLASIIALASILGTNAFNVHQTNLERKRKHKIKNLVTANLLHSIYHEIIGMMQSSKLLQTQIGAIKALNIQENKPVADSVPEKIEVDYLNSCRVKLLDYDTYDSDLVTMLSIYVDVVCRLNRYTDLSYFNLTAVSMTDEDTFGTAAESYFENLDNLFIKAEDKAMELTSDIIASIKRLNPDYILLEGVDG